LTLLEAQRTLYAALRSVREYKLARLQALVSLCKAPAGVGPNKKHNTLRPTMTWNITDECETSIDHCRFAHVGGDRHVLAALLLASACHKEPAKGMQIGCAGGGRKGKAAAAGETFRGRSRPLNPMKS